MAFCTQTHVADILSENGLSLAMDDDGTDSGTVSNAIERAEQDILMHLHRRYETSVLTSHTWIKWACAYLSAVEVYRRRANSVPESLLAKADEILGYLKDIEMGAKFLPDAVTLSDNAGITLDSYVPSLRTGRTPIAPRSSTHPNEGGLEMVNNWENYGPY